MATVYDVHEAEANLSRLLDQAEAGEEVSIARGEGRVVKLVVENAPMKPRGKRVPGTLKGKVWLDERFFEPLPEEELRAWEGRDD